LLLIGSSQLSTQLHGIFILFWQWERKRELVSGSAKN